MLNSLHVAPALVTVPPGDVEPSGGGYGGGVGTDNGIGPGLNARA